MCILRPDENKMLACLLDVAGATGTSNKDSNTNLGNAQDCYLYVSDAQSEQLWFQSICLMAASMMAAL